MTTYTQRKSTFVQTLAGSPLLRITVAWSMIAGQIAMAVPQGAQVVHGQASFSQQGDLTEITAGNNAIINYSSFDIASQETVRFIQPTVNSKVLNRIAGHDPTRIDGSLLANGRVYIVNPAGIYFGNGALVDVGGFFAAAANITNNDFINNVDHFTDVTGSVVNYGTIQSNMVHLIGRHVANHGSILANGGLVSMIVGDDVLLGERDGHLMVKLTGAALDMVGKSAKKHGEKRGGDHKGKVHLGAGDLFSLVLHNSGMIQADQIVIEGGDGSRVQIEGLVDVSNTGVGQVGGAVHVVGDQVEVKNALIDASGDADGGAVHVLGNTVKVTEARIDASAYAHGGTAELLGEKKVEVKNVLIDASGGSDGGTVHIVGDQIKVRDAEIDASGRHAHGGIVDLLGGEKVEVKNALINASGGADGGAVHVLGDTIKVAEGQIDASGNVNGGIVDLLGGKKVEVKHAMINASGGTDDGEVHVVGDQVKIENATLDPIPES